MTSPSPVLQTFGLAKHFRDPAGERVDVLECVDISVRPGLLTVVEGEESSGRTTLVRCLYRTYAPDAGRAYLSTGRRYLELAAASSAAVSWARREHVRIDTGALAAPDRASAGAVLCRAMRRGGTAVQMAERRAINALAPFGIDPARPVRLLDEEQRRVVSLLRALMPPASLVLLDEPLRGVSTRRHDAVLQAVAETCQRGIGVLATASRGSRLSGLADHTVELQQGRAA